MLPIERMRGRGSHAFSGGSTPVISLLFLSATITTGILFAGQSANPAATGIIVANDRWPSAASLQRFGEDCIRLAGAVTDEEKAIAVWRCTVMLTQATEVIPAEPALGLKYIAHPLKLLNVYGGHWCDGLSRIMEMTWRALGYRADKLYKFGHTFADIHYRDADGISRWHVFDLSQRWFAYDRSGTHIATADELALDHSLLYYPSRTPVPSQPSLMQPSHIHTGHLSFEPYTTGLTLRTGERIEFSWNPGDAPYFNLFGKKPFRNALHGPYAVACGSGILTSQPLTDRNIAQEYHLDSSANADWAQNQNGGLQIHPTGPGKTISWILKVALPYIITDVRMNATVLKKTQRDNIAVFVSTDNGSSWRKYWEAQQSQESQTIQDIALSERFNPEGKGPLPSHSPFGRYSYMVKVQMSAGEDPQGCQLGNLTILTKFQHNIFSLPMLWPGRNEVSIDGKLREDRALSIVFDWEDARGNPATKEINVHEVPFQQAIETNGTKWEDVRCRTLSLCAVPRPLREAKEKADATKRAKGQLTLHTVVSTDTIMGTSQRPKPPATSTLLRRVEDILRRQSDPEIADAELRAVAGTLGDTLLALGARRDPAAQDLLVRVIQESRTHAYQHRVWAMQALFNTLGPNSAPALLRVLRKDPGIVFYDPRKQYSKDAMWLHAAATAAAALAAIGNFEGRAEAAGLIEAALRNRMTSAPIRQIWRGEEIEWGLIRALGSIGNKQHAATLYGYLTPGKDSDAMAEAIRALSKMEARDALPLILESLREFQYLPVGLHAIEAIGRLGGQNEIDIILPFLNHGDEEMRAAAAHTLALIGKPIISARLRTAESEEKIQWVREVIHAAAARLETPN